MYTCECVRQNRETIQKSKVSIYQIGQYSWAEERDTPIITTSYFIFILVISFFYSTRFYLVFLASIVRGWIRPSCVSLNCFFLQPWLRYVKMLGYDIPITQDWCIYRDILTSAFINSSKISLTQKISHYRLPFH